MSQDEVMAADAAAIRKFLSRFNKDGLVDVASAIGVELTPTMKGLQKGKLLDEVVATFVRVFLLVYPFCSHWPVCTCACRLVCSYSAGEFFCQSYAYTFSFRHMLVFFLLRTVSVFLDPLITGPLHHALERVHSFFSLHASCFMLCAHVRLCAQALKYTHTSAPMRVRASVLCSAIAIHLIQIQLYIYIIQCNNIFSVQGQGIKFSQLAIADLLCKWAHVSYPSLQPTFIYNSETLISTCCTAPLPNLILTFLLLSRRRDYFIICYEDLRTHTSKRWQALKVFAHAEGGTPIRTPSSCSELAAKLRQALKAYFRHVRGRLLVMWRVVCVVSGARIGRLRAVSTPHSILPVQLTSLPFFKYFGALSFFPLSLFFIYLSFGCRRSICTGKATTELPGYGWSSVILQTCRSWCQHPTHFTWSPYLIPLTFWYRRWKKSTATTFIKHCSQYQARQRWGKWTWWARMWLH